MSEDIKRDTIPREDVKAALQKVMDIALEELEQPYPSIARIYYYLRDQRRKLGIEEAQG